MGTGAVILSQQASRFWIPFDVKTFESKSCDLSGSFFKKSIFGLALTPSEYLEKYCRVNNRRYTLYKRVFDKHKDSEGELPMKVSFHDGSVICFWWWFFSSSFPKHYRMPTCVQLIHISSVKWFDCSICLPTWKSRSHSSKVSLPSLNDTSSISSRKLCTDCSITAMHRLF